MFNNTAYALSMTPYDHSPNIITCKYNVLLHITTELVCWKVVCGSYRSNDTYLDLVYLSGNATTYTARSSILLLTAPRLCGQNPHCLKVPNTC